LTVELGEEFPSVDLMPPVQPHCECSTIEYSKPGFGMMRRERQPHDLSERRRKRDEYREFMRRQLA